MEEHLLLCNDCLNLILLHEKVRREEAVEAIPDVPNGWIKRAVNLLPEKEEDATKGLFDIVLKFAKETIEIIENTGSLSISYEATPVTIRGEKKNLSPNLVTLGKTFPEVESKIEVEKVNEYHVNIKVMITNVDPGAPVEELRISLFNPSLEIASYVSEGGEVYFTDVRFGKYVIKISRRGRKIGRISLNLKE